MSGMADLVETVINLDESSLDWAFLTDFLVWMMLSSRARDRWPEWADEGGRWMMRRAKYGEDGEDEGR
jgi:hypothetical protein